MVGGVSPVTGMNVAWWHPDMDPYKYMKNWCKAKYGQEAGQYVFNALIDTHEITEAFHPTSNSQPATKGHTTESFDMFRWGPAYQPWAVDMQPLLDKIQKGEIDPSFLITHTEPLENAPEMYKKFRDKEDGCIKVVLKP